MSQGHGSQDILDALRNVYIIPTTVPEDTFLTYTGTGETAACLPQFEAAYSIVHYISLLESLSPISVYMYRESALCIQCVGTVHQLRCLGLSLRR